MECALVVKNLYKEYDIRSRTKTNFINLFRKQDTITVLKDISFEINKGEIVGIFGPNGAGKSTLLKIFSEITPPTFGTIEIYGKIASILEIGIGFQPDLSGYDNIFIAGEIYGISRKEIKNKINKIIELFGFPDFIKTPVKYYSSGMYLRLAFSVIINIEADIYFFDEIIGIGDAAFQKKIFSKLAELKINNKAIILVTHNPLACLNLFDRAILMNKGEIKYIGKIDSTAINYDEYSKYFI